MLTLEALLEGIRKMITEKEIYKKYKENSEIRGNQLSIEKCIAAIEEMF